MNIIQGESYWQKSSKIKKTYPYITHNENCDVLIIGGGITGAITAYFLAKDGANIIVSEKNIVGFGCTSGIPATLEYEESLSLNKLEKKLGTVKSKRVHELCLNAIDKIEEIDEILEKNSSFSRKDSIFFTNKFMQKQTISKEFYSKKDAGFSPFFLQNHEVINLNSGILSKDASGVINPYEFTQELFNYLSTLENVKILENTEITEVNPSYDKVECKTNNNFKINSDKVIFTSGIDSIKYLDNIPIDLYKTFTIVTKAVPELAKYNINFTAKDINETQNNIRFTNTNRIIFTGETTKFNDKFNDEKYLNSFAKDKYKKLFQNAKKTFMNIQEFNLDFAYNTTLVNTKDNFPIIDEVPKMQNCFFNLPFSENGILYSVIGANMLKDAVKGYYTKDMNLFKLDRY